MWSIFIIFIFQFVFSWSILNCLKGGLSFFSTSNPYLSIFIRGRCWQIVDSFLRYFCRSLARVATAGDVYKSICKVSSIASLIWREMRWRTRVYLLFKDVLEWPGVVFVVNFSFWWNSDLTLFHFLTLFAFIGRWFLIIFNFINISDQFFEDLRHYFNFFTKGSFCGCRSHLFR